jgi:hypothetical protein
MSQRKFEMKNFEKKLVLNFKLNFFEFWKRKFWRKILFLKFEKKIGHTTRVKWKDWNMPQKLKWKLKWIFLKIFIFEIWNENVGLKFEKNVHITRGKWNKEIIYFVYATEIKLSIIPLYHRCKLWWYTVNLSRQILSYWSFSPTVV